MVSEQVFPWLWLWSSLRASEAHAVSRINFSVTKIKCTILHIIWGFMTQDCWQVLAQRGYLEPGCGMVRAGLQISLVVVESVIVLFPDTVPTTHSHQAEFCIVCINRWYFFSLLCWESDGKTVQVVSQGWISVLEVYYWYVCLCMYIHVQSAGLSWQGILNCWETEKPLSKQTNPKTRKPKHKTKHNTKKPQTHHTTAPPSPKRRRSICF